MPRRWRWKSCCRYSRCNGHFKHSPEGGEFHDGRRLLQEHPELGISQAVKLIASGFFPPGAELRQVSLDGFCVCGIGIVTALSPAHWENRPNLELANRELMESLKCSDAMLLRH